MSNRPVHNLAGFTVFRMMVDPRCRLVDLKSFLATYAVELLRNGAGLENYWSLLKRSINGTYVSVEPFHLFRYLDEQAFRYNNRKDMDDYDRFRLALSQIAGKRLTYEHLTGKDRETDTASVI